MSSQEHAAVLTFTEMILEPEWECGYSFLQNLILFGGMFILYSVYRFKYPDDFHLAAKELNTIIGTFNTAILLTSSLTMALSITAIQRKQKALSIFFQFITIVLALGFMVNKYFEWTAKFHHGIYPGSERLLS